SPSPPATPEQPLPAFCLHYFDMLYSEDIAWTTKGMEEPSQSGAQGGREETQKEPEQCPIIDSQGLGLGAEGDLQASLHLEEHSLEQVQSMVVGEVLKDIETACKLLNITAGGCPHSPPWGAAGRDQAVFPAPRLGGESGASRPSTWTESPETHRHQARIFWMRTRAGPRAGAKHRGLSPPPSHPSPSLPVAGGDASWADSEVDSSCAGQPIHLWQFLKELLLKPHNYGRFIRWLNKEKGGWVLRWLWGRCWGAEEAVTPQRPASLPGIFKIEDSAQVARLWGIRKNRPAMNYDKLSRSIRQYYKKGIIRKPDISQRLVYQFVHPV
ncbi:SPDEF factor, partial [Scopus umbretta]|nr:SPDEF factor [Scopus umbretta]